MNEKKSFLETLLGDLLIVALLAFLSSMLIAPPEAKGQVEPTTRFTLTNLPSFVTGGATSNLTANVYEVRKDRGLSVFAYIAGTNAATTSAIDFKFSVSFDGTNYSTDSPLVFKATPNGATGAILWTNFPPDLLNNVRFLKPLTAKNNNDATNSVFVTNVWFSVSN